MSEQAYRYERKFLVEQVSEPQLKLLVRLHPALFYEPYPPRHVNNLYLDTVGMEHYCDNVDGVGDRRKVRIRWYGELLGEVAKPVLEFKIKQGLVGKKESFPFPAFILDDGFNQPCFQELVRLSNLPGAVKAELRDMSVVLMNRYHRRYYATRDGKYRLTIDNHLEFYRIDRQRNHYAHRQMDYLNTVLELKYGVAGEVSANRVSSYFPFPVTKSSKYVQGIERVFF